MERKMELDSRFRMKYGRNWERDKRIIKKLRTYDRVGIFPGSAYCLRRGRKGETEKRLDGRTLRCPALNAFCSEDFLIPGSECGENLESCPDIPDHRKVTRQIEKGF